MIKLKFTALFIALILFLPQLMAQDAKAIIKRVDDKMQGESNKSEMSMTIVRPKYTRTISFRNWSLGREFFMTYITAPAKDKGQVSMKFHNEMWNYIPNINRMVKLPPSMMSQSWMGSDYSNDDLIKQSSIVVDYDQNVVAEEQISEFECYKIEMIPHEDANVVWGKVVLWIVKAEDVIAKGEYYDEEFELVRTELGRELSEFGGRKLFKIMEIISADEEGHKTVIEIESMEFNIAIKESFFTQQNMKRVK